MKKFFCLAIVLMFSIAFVVGCAKPQESLKIDPIDTSKKEEEQTDNNDIIDEPNIDVSVDTDNEEDELTDVQKNSIAMLNYLTVTAEEIGVEKNNRLILKDIYSDLLNDINPAIDEETQKYLRDLRNTIKDLLKLDAKRSQLQYIYNQNKASAMKEAVPDPLAVLSMANSLDWKRLAISVSFTLIDSYNNYKTASTNADQEYLLSGWELDQEEEDTILDSRGNWFDYMSNIVDEYGDGDKRKFGNITLNQEDVSKFANIRSEENVHSKIQSLEYALETYKFFGNYWLELAECYYEIGEYNKCLNCVQEYQNLDIQIFRKDFNIVSVLPKAIVSALKVYDEDQFVSVADSYAKMIIDNTSDEDWSVRYFAAQTYLDLYAKTNDKEYLKEAYDITLNNVNVLKKEQEKINEKYLADVEKETLPKTDEGFLSPKEKENLKKQTKEEQKKLDAYNKKLEETREKELLSLYEPLVINCELLFALADTIEIDEAEQTKIRNVLQIENNGVFLSKPVNSKYSFESVKGNYSIELSKDKIIIPTDMLVSDAIITVTVVQGKEKTTFDDFEIEKVERKGETIDTFKAYYISKKMKKHKWSADAKITIQIDNGTYFEHIVFNYKVKEYKGNWIFPDSVKFEKV